MTEALRRYDPWFYDLYQRELKGNSDDLAQYHSLLLRIARNVRNEKKKACALEFRIKRMLSNGDRENAARLALRLQSVKANLDEHQKLLEIHELVYENEIAVEKEMAEKALCKFELDCGLNEPESK